MPAIFYPQEKAFNDVASLVEFFVEIMFDKRIVFVGNTNSAALRPDKIPNMR